MAATASRCSRGCWRRCCHVAATLPFSFCMMSRRCRPAGTCMGDRSLSFEQAELAGPGDCLAEVNGTVMARPPRRSRRHGQLLV
jgi:hypothetical protein